MGMAAGPADEDGAINTAQQILFSTQLIKHTLASEVAQARPAKLAPTMVQSLLTDELIY